MSLTKHRLGLVILAGIVLMLGIQVFQFTRKYLLSDKRARDEIRRFYKQIELGLSEQQVRDVFAANHFDRITLFDFSEDVLLVQTPLQFNAANWLLWISLTNGVVESVRFSIQDDRRVRPKNAPPDKRR